MTRRRVNDHSLRFVDDDNVVILKYDRDVHFFRKDFGFFRLRNQNSDQISVLAFIGAFKAFLTVDTAGFKLSGVQDAIDAAVSAETEAREDADDAIESALTLTAQTLVEMIENAASAATTEVVEPTRNGPVSYRF